MAQTNLVGKTILGYKVTEKINAGAFGTVYKAVKENASGQYVRALKHITLPTQKQYNSVLNSMGGDINKANDYFASMLDSIVSEIHILDDLSERNSSNIVRYYENDIVVTEKPRRYDIYILMEYLTPLDEYIEEHPFTVKDVIALGTGVLQGLQLCHSNHIIHRDIKDDNIFVSARGQYKIGDFGVSKVLKGSSRAESLKGTPGFLAPEVYLGKGSYTQSVDLYSLGMVLYKLLNCGREPFLPHFPEPYSAEDEDAAFERRMSGLVPDPPTLGGEALGKVMVKALSNSETRFQTAEAFLSALTQAAAQTPPEELEKGVQMLPPIGVAAGRTSSDAASSYELTISEDAAPSPAQPETSRSKQSSSANKYLFQDMDQPGWDKQSVQPQEPPEEKQKINRSNVFGGYIVAVLVCVICVLILALILVFLFLNHKPANPASSASSSPASSVSSVLEAESEPEPEPDSSSVPTAASEPASSSEPELEPEPEPQTYYSAPAATPPPTPAPEPQPEPAPAVSSQPTDTSSGQVGTDDIMTPGFTGEESLDEMMSSAEAYAQQLLDSLQ